MFENVIGNKSIKNTLEKSIKTNQITHSYLMIGIQGIGKKLLAKEYAKEILGSNDIINNPDFLCIEPDGNSIKIEQIRNLQKEIQEKPIISKKKVYIIDDADLMTKEAQNCLLKTLEEPPEFAVIILIGANENAFLPTIKSRCIILHFNRLSDLEIKSYLQQQYKELNVTQSMLDIAGGSIGRAINLKDKQEQYLKVEEIINILDKKDLIDIIQASEILYKSKEDINDILDYINIILLKKAKENYLYTNCIKIVENTKKRLAQNANYDMSIDDMLFKMWEEI
ncbi:MAG: AAA family ATPase [Clostridia bacterium]|nr:AAA family ATPase [Clostridia bacterium]